MKNVFVMMTLTTLVSATVFATTVKILPTKYKTERLFSNSNIEKLIRQKFDVESFREVRVQVITKNQNVDHLIVLLLKKGLHGVTVASLPIDEKLNSLSAAKFDGLTAEDLSQQVRTSGAPKCPNPEVEFISFAPNDDEFEVGIAKDVATEAKSKNLVTIELYREAATSQAWLDYMSCPKLKGNFYDGDSNPQVVVTNDGVINSTEFTTLLPKAFRQKVVNIWLACQAFNEPMLPSVMTDAQSQKFAAGVNNLQIGPSDQAAKCTMIAGINGQPLTKSFDDCYKKLDVPEDHWGFAGPGADFLGQ